jgi:diphthamide synthase (EF-2-diphthine--ammonia ligase)
VVELLTAVRDGRVRGHGVPTDLLASQADAVGYPLRTVELPGDEGGYERAMRAVFDTYDHREVDRVAYADLFVDAIREYRESLLADYDVGGYWPLWGQSSAATVDGFLDAGFAATVARVDGDALDASLACRSFDRELLAALPAGADPCGENGEFHTFVIDGPPFETAVPVESAGHYTETVAEGTHSGTYHYCDLRLAE